MRMCLCVLCICVFVRMFMRGSDVYVCVFCMCMCGFVGRWASEWMWMDCFCEECSLAVLHAEVRLTRCYSCRIDTSNVQA